MFERVLFFVFVILGTLKCNENDMVTVSNIVSKNALEVSAKLFRKIFLYYLKKLSAKLTVMLFSQPSQLSYTDIHIAIHKNKLS